LKMSEKPSGPGFNEDLTDLPPAEIRNHTFNNGCHY
jgi:hypothetical protein